MKTVLALLIAAVFSMSAHAGKFSSSRSYSAPRVSAPSRPVVVQRNTTVVQRNTVVQNVQRGPGFLSNMASSAAGTALGMAVVGMFKGEPAPQEVKQ